MQQLAKASRRVWLMADGIHQVLNALSIEGAHGIVTNGMTKPLRYAAKYSLCCRFEIHNRRIAVTATNQVSEALWHDPALASGGPLLLQACGVLALEKFLCRKGAFEIMRGIARAAKR